MSQLLLSRSKLSTFLQCQRRFQLRYVQPLTWPETPLSAAEAQRLAWGQQFHQLLQRHFLGLPVEADLPTEGPLASWWGRFKAQLPLPHGRLMPELTLTVPVGRHLLHGRFDLLLMGERHGRLFAHIYDWKTGQPPPEDRLRHDWQTRLYLAMICRSGSALAAAPPPPDQVSLTYWYADAPDHPLTIAYSQAWHEQNWADIEALVAQIDARLAQDGVWPLTDDWQACAACLYQAVCGRQAAGTAVGAIDELEEADGRLLDDFEPQLP